MGYQKSSNNSTSPVPPPRSRSTLSSYTRREIERFWRKKQLVEEDHLFHAIKAAARLRAARLTEEEYRLFVESLDDVKTMDDMNDVISKQDTRVGIKDWWTKSKYAYLNEPAIGAMRPNNRRSNYKPNNIILPCNYMQLSSTSAKTPSFVVC